MKFLKSQKQITKKTLIKLRFRYDSYKKNASSERMPVDKKLELCLEKIELKLNQ